MLQRLFPWVGGFTVGLVASACTWLLLMSNVSIFATTIPNIKQGVERTMIASLIDAGVNNPDVQATLRNQVILYLKSPEGKAKMAEVIKSPEMVKALSDSMQSPEVRTAVLNMMQVPEFRAAVLEMIKEAPEMKILSVLSSAITPENQDHSPPPATQQQH